MPHNIDENCRYEFNFNGDGYIETARRWNPDAIDPSFTLEFYNDTSTKLDSWLISQATPNTHFSTWELVIDTTGAGALSVLIGGSNYGNAILAGDAGLALWRIEFNSANSTIKSYKNNILVRTIGGVSVGTARQPTASFNISGAQNYRNDKGIAVNVKFWINTQTTNDLALDMPINDNSTTIKDYSDNEQDGILTAGTGQWQAKREGDCSICELSHEGGTVLTGFGEIECK